MKLLFMKFSPLPCYLVPLKPKYSPQHPICLSLVYWIKIPLHVSGVSTAHHQEVKCIYVANGTCYTVQLNVRGLGWSGPLHPGSLTVILAVPFATYIHLTTWRWAADTPETCRGILIQ
jgi:hypothetical protein